MLDSIPRLQARRTLRELSMKPDIKVKGKAIYDLTLLATGSVADAQRAEHDHIAATLRRGETPE